MKTTHALAALLCGAMLAGCGNAPGNETQRAVFSAVLDRSKAAPTPRLTAAAVAAAPAPMIEVRAANRQALVIKVAETQGVATYVSGDGVTLGLRDHMLVAVKGLHSDVMSSAPPTAQQIASAEGSYRRSYQILDGLGQLQKHEFDCTLSRGPSEEIVIAERTHPVQVVNESCRNASNRFENRYWIEAGGKIRQSDQWIGSSVDFLRLSFG